MVVSRVCGHIQLSHDWVLAYLFQWYTGRSQEGHELTSLELTRRRGIAGVEVVDVVAGYVECTTDSIDDGAERKSR